MVLPCCQSIANQLQDEPAMLFSNASGKIELDVHIYCFSFSFYLVFYGCSLGFKLELLTIFSLKIDCMEGKISADKVQ